MKLLIWNLVYWSIFILNRFSQIDPKIPQETMIILAFIYLFGCLSLSEKIK